MNTDPLDEAIRRRPFLLSVETKPIDDHLIALRVNGREIGICHDTPEGRAALAKHLAWAHPLMPDLLDLARPAPWLGRAYWTQAPRTTGN